MSIDDSELRALSLNIGRASTAMIVEAAKVVAKGALTIKNETRAGISDHPSWRKLKSTVTFEQVGLTADIGYEDRGQGELAGIAEFGSARHAPHPALIPAAKAEGPRYEKAMTAAAAKVLEGL